MIYHATGYTVKFMDCSCRLSSTITHVTYPQNEIRYVLIEGSQTCRLPSRYTILLLSIFTPDPQVTSELDLLKEDRAFPIRLIVIINQCIEFYEIGLDVSSA